MNTETNHPLPTIRGVQQDRRHYEGTVFEYRGKTFCLTLTEWVDGDGYISVQYWKTDPHEVVPLALDPGNHSDVLSLTDDEIAKSGFDKDQFEPEFVKELCRYIDAALVAEGVQ